MINDDDTKTIDPTNLCPRHVHVEKAASMMEQVALDVAEIKAALLGTMEKQGLINRVVELEKFRCTMLKICWTFGGAFVAGAGAWVFTFMVK